MATIIFNGSYSTNKCISPKKIFCEFSNYENSFRIISNNFELLLKNEEKKKKNNCKFDRKIHFYANLGKVNDLSNGYLYSHQ